MPHEINVKPVPIVILDCFSGISGDMTIGAFLDNGMDFAYLKKELKKLALDGYSLQKKKVMKKEIEATQFFVRLKPHSHDHHARTFSDIKKMIMKSTLDEAVKTVSLSIFSELAKAEATVHGTTVGKVHFHEVGAVDSIVDIVGVAICLDYFGVKKIYSRNIHIGTGFLHGKSHGSIPIPAPATAKLLEGYHVTFSDIEQELVTPTGASFVRALTKPKVKVPPLVIEKIGYGAGERSCEHQANVLRMIFAKKEQSYTKDAVLLIETNIDDMQPVLFEPVMEMLLNNDALDVYVTSIMMKKNRPAYTVSVLCSPRDKEKIVEILFKHTSTIGVRYTQMARMMLEREAIVVKTEYGKVTVKVSVLLDGTKKISPEYDECKRLAKRKKISVQEVYNAVHRVWEAE